MSWWAAAFEIQLSFQSELLSLWVTYATSKAGKLILFLINLCRIHLCLCKLRRGQAGKRLQLSKSCWWLHGCDKVLKWLLQQWSKEISKKRQSHVRQELSPFFSLENRAIPDVLLLNCLWTLYYCKLRHSQIIYCTFYCAFAAHRRWWNWINSI